VAGGGGGPGVHLLRIVSYAINGRGMGHLVRQLAILRWIRRLLGLLDRSCECWVLTSSEADTLARREGVPSLKMPSKAMLRDAGLEPARYLRIARSWTLNALAGLAPDLLLVDTFPGGSFGELVSGLELAQRRVLVARRVKPGFAEADGYRALLPLYHRVITPDGGGVGPILLREPYELLERAEARAALGVPEGRRAVYLSTGGGGDPGAAQTLTALAAALGERWHLVVGAGPLYQGPELRGPGVTWLSRYLSCELLPGVDAAVSAGGYNSFHELMSAGVPTVFLPRPRVADDQAERARRAEAAGAGRVAASLAEVPALLEDPGDPAAARALVPAGGALAAAVAALEGLVPAEELAWAAGAWSPALAALLRGDEAGGTKRLAELVRLLAGASPAELGRRRAALLAMADEGAPGAAALAGGLSGPADPGPRLARFAALRAECGLPLDLAVSLLRGLARKFPAARGAPLLAACERLFPTWARFDDWMGAISLLRAVPVQRGYALSEFSEALCGWLDREEDLFDALRAFSRLEGRGRRTVPEVLALLGSGEEVR
jgi:UDP-N-acetylglucosamine--N-acetylmuramyl-(pentapeptide) pyrophosphoryl-undecaprenol N-acetylglucosamine transferase